MPKVAAIQFMPAFRDPLGNLRRIVGLAMQAAQSGAKAIVLPELATTGYSFMSPAEAEPFAEDLTAFRPNAVLPATGISPCPSMSAMSTLAQKFGVCIAWGLAEKDVGTGRLYNSQALICPDGRFESYRKANLWGNDLLWAHEGRANPPILDVRIDGIVKKVGLLICRDVRDKKDEHWDSFYQKGDADIVCFSANWGEGGFPATAWMDFCKENHTTLIVSNRYGDESEKPNKFGGGGSCIITTNTSKEHPNGVYCDGLLWNQDCIVYADV
jgi:predicted amidohydrolase